MLPILSPSVLLKALPWLLAAAFLYLYIAKIRDYENCQAGAAYQNAVVLQQAKLGQEAQDRYQRAEKEAYSYANGAYTSIEQHRAEKVPTECEAAVRHGVEALQNWKP